MDLKKIKRNILNKSLSDALIIFKCDDDYIPNQYIHAISQLKNLSINYIQDIDALTNRSTDIFNSDTNLYLNVLKCDDFKCNDKFILSKTNYIIITSKITDSETADLFSEVIVDVPKMESWFIKDFVYSVLPKCDDSAKDYLIALCNNNVYRVDQELSKLALFDEKEQNKILNLMIKENSFGDLSVHTIFDFTNAIIKRDLKKLELILNEFNSIDIEPLGVVKLLTNNFEKVLSIQLDRNATADRVGMTSKQFYAVSQNLNRYGDNNLLRIYDLVTDIDRKLKQGEISNDRIIDYLLVNILI